MIQSLSNYNYRIILIHKVNKYFFTVPDLSVEVEGDSGVGGLGGPPGGPPGNSMSPPGPPPGGNGSKGPGKILLAPE